MAMANSGLYVGHLFRFQHIQQADWKVSPERRFEQQVAQWFNGFDFNDTLALRSRQMNEFMNGYIGLFGARATTVALRDSLFAEAGRLACEQVSTGHPKVYGWMVDYFYRGYETYNITRGLKILETHINNPRCLTAKKQEIARRLEGIKKLLPGTELKNLRVHDTADREHLVDLKNGEKDYQLVVFYDSDCGHCKELLTGLRDWYAIPENRAWFGVYSVALDDTREKWEPVHTQNAFPWTDMYAPGGVNSQAASDYYVLSTPNMFVADKQGILVDMPGTVQELDKFLNGSPAGSLNRQ
jgi:hypothetical protein